MFVCFQAGHSKTGFCIGSVNLFKGQCWFIRLIVDPQPHLGNVMIQAVCLLESQCVDWVLWCLWFYIPSSCALLNKMFSKSFNKNYYFLVSSSWQNYCHQLLPLQWQQIHSCTLPLRGYSSCLHVSVWEVRRVLILCLPGWPQNKECWAGGSADKTHPQHLILLMITNPATALFFQSSSKQINAYTWKYSCKISKEGTEAGVISATQF